MNSFIVLALCVAVAVASPINSDSEATVLKYENNNIGVEGYNYGYEGSNNIRANEEGQLKNVGTENEALEVRGEFAYVGTDGVTYQVTYIANENGFQPQGAHLPVAP